MSESQSAAGGWASATDHTTVDRDAVDRDAATAASRFAPPGDLERIAAARPDLHPVLAANPATPSPLLKHVAQSADPRVQEALRRQSQKAEAAPHPWAAASRTDAPLTPGPSAAPSAAPPSPPLTTLTPRPPRRRRLARSLAVVLAVLLALGGVGGAGWYWWQRDWSSTTVSTTGVVMLSDSWVAGAHTLWREAVDRDAEVVVLGSYLLALSGQDSTSDTVTAHGYRVTPTALEDIWTSELPRPGEDSPVDPLDTPTPLTLWGQSTAVYGSVLIDLETGSTSSAPWNDDQAAGIAGTTAITCTESDRCTAWGEDRERLWSLSLPDMGTDAYSDGASADYTSSVYLPVFRHGDDEFVIIAGAVINMATGDPLPLTGPRSDYAYTLAAQDGWALVSSRAGRSAQTVTTYTVEGSKLDEITVPREKSLHTVGSWTALRTLDQITSDLRDPGPSASGVLVRTDSSYCVYEVVVEGENSFPVPHRSTDTTSCPATGILLSQRTAIALVPNSYNPTNAFTSIMDLRTGAEVEFPGTDPQDGTTYTASSPELVIAASPGDGTLTAYAPGT
ncbi:hypothetical protein [Actinomyces lilanjuaniae]|uniref:variant leucine-rich repeat-containing protein n=1 Tax=Actinomyces lilanjuaniae TaxID=2321394 RepID=UPI0013C497D0|nr:hypothetical protein [Actinomyces lilanjuaniae]